MPPTVDALIIVEQFQEYGGTQIPGWAAEGDRHEKVNWAQWRFRELIYLKAALHLRYIKVVAYTSLASAVMGDLARAGAGKVGQGHPVARRVGIL